MDSDSMKVIDPSRSDIQKFFQYNPVDGLMYRKKHRQKDLIGTPVIRPTTAGYMRVIMLGREYYVHRLAWIVCHGPIPDGMEIDHIDRNPSNNRIKNLRLASRSQNEANASMDKRNTSGFRGVHKHGPSWRVQTKFGGKIIRVGRFKSRKQASDFFDALARARWGSRYHDAT